MDIHRHRPEHDSVVPMLSEEGLLFLGGLFGLTPSFRAGGNGQPLAEAAEALKPDFAADAEFIERELFVAADACP